MEPPRKAPKLSLFEAADILNQQHPNLGTVQQASSNVSVAQNHEQTTTKAEAVTAAAADDDFSQEEEEENTQIQASLPHYFDHLFGTCIGHSQSQIHSSFHPPSQSQGILPQCSFGFSLDTRILDSQGFVFNPSVPSNCPVSAPLAPLSPTQTTPCQPTSSDSANATVFKSSSTESPNAIIFSSPSSTSSSPGTRSNRSGTPVLFPSPSSVHSRSPEKAIPKFNDTQIQESLCSSDKPEPPSRVSPHQQQDAKSGVFLSPSLRKQLTCTQGSHSHQTVCRKRRLDFEAVTSIPAGDKPNYVCPPSCIPLSDCSQIHSKVSIFAVVLQGNLILYMDEYSQNLMICSSCSQSCHGGSLQGWFKGSYSENAISFLLNFTHCHLPICCNLCTGIK